MTASPTETAIKARLATIAAAATSITVLAYRPILDMPGVNLSTLGLLQSGRLHFGFISKSGRQHIEKTIGHRGATERIGVYRINFVCGTKVDGTGEAIVNGNVEALANYFENYHDSSSQIFPPATYPGVTIVAGQGSGREDGESVETLNNQWVNVGWYQLTVRVGVQRG